MNFLQGQVIRKYLLSLKKLLACTRRTRARQCMRTRLEKVSKKSQKSTFDILFGNLIHLDFPITNTLVHAPEDVYKYLLEVLSPMYEDSEVQPDENHESMV